MRSLRLSLFWKLMAAFALVILVAVAGAALWTGSVTALRFERYARGREYPGWQARADELAQYYTQNGSWEGVDALLARGHRGGGGLGGPPQRLADAGGVIVASADGQDVGQRVSRAELQAGLPVELDGQTLGYLLPLVSDPLSDDALEFLGSVRRALALSAGASLVLALGVGALLFRGITAPLRRVVSASRAVAAGDLDVRVPARSRDELGELAEAFNQMTADLQRAETARRQQMADIAHDLRTPLTVIQGSVEGMLDGVFEADAENLQPVLEQAQVLGRLIEDLRTLSLAEAGKLALQRSPVDLAEWLPGLVRGFEPRAAAQEVALALRVPSTVVIVSIDELRIRQVLGNLLDNALRHTPPGGRVEVALAQDGQTARVDVCDDGPGVAQADLPRLFDRFWRAEGSRSRQTGGSGLGLAIVRAIVEAHGGRVWAVPARPSGLCVCLELPLAGAS